MLARGNKVAVSAFQHAIQIEKIRIVRGLCKELACQRHGSLVFRIKNQHLQINALGLDIFRLAAGKLLCHFVGLLKTQLLDIDGHKRRRKRR